jgi:hypothetical protein
MAVLLVVNYNLYSNKSEVENIDNLKKAASSNNIVEKAARIKAFIKPD